MATVDDRQWIKDCFSLVDKEKKGVIPLTEVGKAMRALGLKPSPTTADIKAIEKEIAETHKVTEINLDLFNKLMQPRMAKQARSGESAASAAVMNAFKVFDNDGDGFISADELMHALSKMGQKMPKADVQKLIETMDTDGDGHIGPEEFLKLMNADI